MYTVIFILSQQLVVDPNLFFFFFLSEKIADWDLNA